MRVIIIDGDKSSIDALSLKLAQHAEIDVVGTAPDGKRGMALVRKAEPAAVFLDIELPDISGLEFLEQLHELAPECKAVVYTSCQKHMLSAFRSKAFDYLLKPANEADLRSVVERLLASREEHRLVAPVKAPPSSHTDNNILVYTNSVDFRIVHIRDIGIFQYNHDLRLWEVIVAGRHDPIRLKRAVNNELLLAIDPRFVQVSQRYIVNVNYLLEVNDNCCRFYPPFDKLNYVNVGRTYRKKLIERFCTL